MWKLGAPTDLSDARPLNGRKGVARTLGEGADGPETVSAELRSPRVREPGRRRARRKWAAAVVLRTGVT